LAQASPDFHVRYKESLPGWNTCSKSRRAEARPAGSKYKRCMVVVFREYAAVDGCDCRLDLGLPHPMALKIARGDGVVKGKSEKKPYFLESFNVKRSTFNAETLTRPQTSGRVLGESE